MRIAYVMPAPPRLSETFIYNELSALIVDGRVEVVPLYTWPNGRAGNGRMGIELLRYVRSGHAQDALFVSATNATAHNLDKLLGSTRLDLIHANFLNFPTRTAIELGRRRSVPVTATGHAADYLVQPPKRLSKTLRELDHVFGISEKTCADLTKAGAQSVSLVRAGVSRKLDSESATRRNPRLHAPKILTVARLVAKKGIMDCVHIALRLRELSIEFDWCIIGDGPLRHELDKAIQSLGLADYVFPVGSKPHEEVLDRIRGSDIAVLPAKPSESGDEDGLPVFAIESAALGVPIITTWAGGIEDLIPRGSVALHEPGDIEGMAVATAKVLNNDELYFELAEANRSRFNEEFSAAKQVDRYLQIWHSTCGAEREKWELL